MPTVRLEPQVYEALKKLAEPFVDTPSSVIRRAVFMGDGWNYDVWDGDKYVGVLGAGNLLQHRAA